MNNADLGLDVAEVRGHPEEAHGGAHVDGPTLPIAVAARQVARSWTSRPKGAAIHMRNGDKTWVRARNNPLQPQRRIGTTTITSTSTTRLPLRRSVSVPQQPMRCCGVPFLSSTEAALNITRTITGRPRPRRVGQDWPPDDQRHVGQGSECARAEWIARKMG